jgi:hypothetical protein
MVVGDLQLGEKSEEKAWGRGKQAVVKIMGQM